MESQHAGYRLARAVTGAMLPIAIAPVAFAGVGRGRIDRPMRIASR
jgi:hypothetical protein